MSFLSSKIRESFSKGFGSEANKKFGGKKYGS
jgi:hypothetical protein